MRAEDSKRQCLKCKHKTGVLTCKAFPIQIPFVFLTGRAYHDEVIYKQRNSFIFEPTDRFKHQFEEPREIDEDKQIRKLYPAQRKKLPKLIIEEVIKRGYKIEDLDMITYKAKRPYDGKYSAKINLLPIGETISLEFDDWFSSEFEIQKAFTAINFIERIYDNTRETLFLKIYDIENYEYVDERDNIVPPAVPDENDS